MCDPISMIGFGLSAASAVTGYEAQSVQADAQNKMAAQNRVNSMQAFADTTRSLNDRESEQDAADSQKHQQNDLATQSAEATAIAAGAAGGVQGHSLEDILGDYGARDARANDTVDQQGKWNIDQIQSEKVGAGDQQVSRINSVPNAIAPSFADAALRVASGGITTVTGYQHNQYLGMGGNPFAIGGFN